MACKYLETNWIGEMTEHLHLLHPDVPEKDIEDFVIEEYFNSVQDHECMIYNNYENTVVNTTLGGVLDWIQKEKPLIAESGVFFYPKHKKRNVNIEIIKECMLDARNIHKGEMFAAMDIGDMFTAAVKECQQLNDKKAANSGYGAEGEHSSFLFNYHSAMSVTASGRGELSTAMNCFENLLGDFVKFFNMDEFFTCIHNTIHEEKGWKFKTFDIINRVPSRKKWVKRFTSKFLHHSMYDENRVGQVYDSLDDEMRVRTYYKSNLRAFLTDNFIPNDLFCKLANTKCDFIDPNKIPEVMKEKLESLAAMVTEFVNYKHNPFRYEDRARYQKRAITVVADTDSNFLNYGPILKFVKDKILPFKMFKKSESRDNYDIKILNILSTFASYGIADTLWNYLGHVNVAEEDRKYIKMKNEFYYRRIIVTYAKKSYIALMTRKESHVYPKPKIDVKGVNFFKSTASKKTSDFIYDDVLMKELLAPKSGNISLKDTYKTIYDFQQRIREEIEDGDMGYLKRSIKVKSPDAYANPYRISQYKAVYVWNYVNDEREHIDLPATTTTVKVKLQSKKDVAALAPWPKIYNKMIELFETNPEIGDHIEVKDGKERKVKGKGINAIALPNDYEEVPDWLLAVIDVDTLTSDNMKLFVQLMKPLGLSEQSVNISSGNNANYYCNIVRL